MRGSATIDRQPAHEPRVVDNPFRRESHRPWYARRGPRWVVAIGVAVLLGLNAFAFKKVGTHADPISVDTAVARFRAGSTTQPSNRAAAANEPGTAGTTRAAAAPVHGTSEDHANASESSAASAGTAGAVGVERGPTPAPGVYVYDTHGYEQADVLGGARHDYPGTTTMTLTSTGCGVDMRWTPIEQRFDDWDTCVDGSALRLRTYTTHHEFFGQSEEHEFNCSGVDIRPDVDTPGTVTTGTCTDANGPNHATTKTTVIGPDIVEVQGVAVPAIEFHLEQYLSGDMNGSEISDIWLRPSDGLLMRWTSVIEAKGKTVFGQTHFHEEDSITLTDVAPRQ